jgi:uncharacterized protein YdeI (YjbR/CyaY-like superfamily)
VTEGRDQPRFFRSRAEFRAWLARHHDGAAVLWVGFWKKASGKGGLTYEEAVEESLCFGWIDGVVNRIDEHAYKQRFTPRRKGSIWSAVNLAKIEKLRAAGLIAHAGLAIFEARDPRRANVYGFENPRELPPAIEKRFRAKKRAWAFFEAQPPGYRRQMAHWVGSAKKEETREKRFTQLLEACADGRRIE